MTLKNAKMGKSRKSNADNFAHILQKGIFFSNILTVAGCDIICIEKLPAWILRFRIPDFIGNGKVDSCLYRVRKKHAFRDLRKKDSQNKNYI